MTSAAKLMRETLKKICWFASEYIDALTIATILGA